MKWNSQTLCRSPADEAGAGEAEAATETTEAPAGEGEGDAASEPSAKSSILDSWVLSLLLYLLSAGSDSIANTA